MTDARTSGLVTEVLGAATAEARTSGLVAEVLGVRGSAAVYVKDIATGVRVKAWSSGVLYDIQITS